MDVVAAGVAGCEKRVDEYCARGVAGYVVHQILGRY